MPTLISLFSGAGGLDVGLEQAGFETVTATDFDEDCVRSLFVNQGRKVPVVGRPGHFHLEGTKVVHADVADLSGVDLVPEGLPDDWVPDLLVGGPPCQPFSSSGKQRSVLEGRGRLFEHFVRLARELKPRAILFENVRGLVTARGRTGHPGEVLAEVKDAFEKAGYATSFKLLNSADYGAPQRPSERTSRAAAARPSVRQWAQEQRPIRADPARWPLGLQAGDLRRRPGPAVEDGHRGEYAGLDPASRRQSASVDRA